MGIVIQPTNEWGRAMELYAEVERLKAEVERLKAEVERLQAVLRELWLHAQLGLEGQSRDKMLEILSEALEGE